jgi:hypothetical protein
MKKEFALFSKGLIIIEKKNSDLNKRCCEFITKNLSDLGFILDSELVNVLKTYSKEEASEFYKNISTFIIEKLRTDIYHEPMYPNFPQQVMEMDMFKLNVNALVHYICCGQVLPKYEKHIRKDLKDKNRLKVLSLGTNKDMEDTFINLINAKTSISKEDSELIEIFIEENKDEALNLLPDEIYMRENNAFIMSLIIKNIVFSEKIIKKYIKTVIDVLRLV